MINLIKDSDGFILQLGYDFIAKAPKRNVPVSRAVAVEMASRFNEEFAVQIGGSDDEWSLESFKLTHAPDHPLGWTDPRPRTILHYNEQSWHMIAPEIAAIGKMAQRALEEND